jgi:hypothetical protein
MARPGSGALILAAFLTTLLGCASITGSDEHRSLELRISGRVTDVHGQPIQGASVLLEATPFSTMTPTIVGSARTDAVGNYAMTVGPAPGYATINCSILRLHVSADGYLGVSTWKLDTLHQVDCRNGGHARLNFVLEEGRELSSLEVLVVVGDEPDDQDRYLMELLESSGHTVSHLMVHEAAPDGDFHDTEVILVAPSAGGLTPDFREVPLGMLVFEPTGWEGFGMASDVSQLPGTSEILVTDAGHPILKWAGMAEATHGISLSSSGTLWTAGTVGPGARVLAWSPSGDAAAVFLYEAGAELLNGASAQGRRVAFAFTPPDLLYLSGERLLVTALEWAAGLSLPDPGPLPRVLVP